MKTYLFLSLFMAHQALAETPAEILFVAPPPHFISNPQVQQCIGALPKIGWMGFDHTWLATEDQSFGMPYSLTQDPLFGGPASILSPDPSFGSLASKPTCKPVYQPENVPFEKFTRTFACLTSKLTDNDESWDTSWQPVFRYHWAKSNCHSAVRFILDCAGGAMPLNPNGGIGSQYNLNGLLNVWIKNSNNPFYSETQSFQKLFQQFLIELEGLGQNQSAIEEFLQNKTTPLLSESQTLMENLKRARDLRRMGLYRRLQKFNLNLKKLAGQLQQSVSSDGLQKMKSLNELFRQPDIITKTYQQVCEQAQKECL